MTLHDRVYMVADVAFIEPLLSSSGLQTLGVSRKSNDGAKVIRCINHPSERIEAMFAYGVDVPATLAQCETLTHEQAEALMGSPGWAEPYDSEATA